MVIIMWFFFFQAEDGIRDRNVTGVQTCALPILNRVEDIVKLGDELTVMVIDIDPAGKIRLSRTAVLEGWSAEEARERDRRPSGGGRPGGRDGGRGGERERDRGPRPPFRGGDRGPRRP